MSTHCCIKFDPGCFRCDLSQAEGRPDAWWETVNAGIVHSKWGYHVSMTVDGPLGRLGYSMVLDEWSHAEPLVYKMTLDKMVRLIDERLHRDQAVLSDE